MLLWGPRDLHQLERPILAQFPWSEIQPSLELAPAFHGAGHGDFVGVLDVGAGGDAGGNAGDAQRGRDAVDLSREVSRGGFAFGGGRGCEDDLADGSGLETLGVQRDRVRRGVIGRLGRCGVGLAYGEARQQVGDAELLRTNAADGRKRAVQHVVNAVVAARLLDGGDVGGLFHDTDDVLVADGAGAVAAGVDVGDVVADGAEAEAGFDLADRVGKGLRVRVGRTQDVESEPLRRLGPDAGQLAQLVDEAGHGFGESRHVLTYSIPGRLRPPVRPPIMPATDDLIASSARRPASLTAAAIRSSSSSISPVEAPSAVGSILRRRTSFLPFMRTWTMPPPVSASTMVSASFCSICACISRAWDIISFILAISEKFIGCCTSTKTNAGILHCVQNDKSKMRG